jgi:hypothetical protein
MSKYTMSELFTKKQVNKISCLTSHYDDKASNKQLTEVIKWGNGQGYDIIISENFHSVILSLSKEHLAMINVMIRELNLQE